MAMVVNSAWIPEHSSPESPAQPMNALAETPAKPNKTDAGNGSYGICRVIDVSRSPSPDPKR